MLTKACNNGYLCAHSQRLLFNNLAVQGSGVESWATGDVDVKVGMDG